MNFPTTFSQEFEVRYFGAQTLHKRICSQWGGLSEPERQAVREATQHMMARALGSTENQQGLVTTRLAAAFSAIAVRDAATGGGGAHEQLEAVAQSVATGDETTCRIALLTLSSMPEEWRKAELSDTGRGFARKKLVPVLDSLLPGLPRILDPQCPLARLALDTLKAWGDEYMSLTAIHSHGVLTRLVELLVSPDFSEDVGAIMNDCLSRSSRTDPQQAVQACIQMIPALAERFEHATSSDDEEVAWGIAQFTVGLGEGHMQILLAGFHQGGSAAFALALRIMAHPSHRVSMSSFEFWNELSSSIDDLGLYSPAEYGKVEGNDHLREVYGCVVEVMLGTCRYPEGFTTWAESEEDEEELLERRRFGGDVLLAAADAFPSHFLKAVQTVLSTQGGGWAHAEVAVWALAAVADSAVSTLDEPMQELFGLILGGSWHTAHRCVVLSILGLFQTWAEYITGVETVMDSVMHALVPALRTEVAQAGAVALKKLCVAEPAALSRFLSSLLVVVEALQADPKAAPELRLELVSAVSHALGALSPADAATGVLRILTPSVQRIEAVLQSDGDCEAELECIAEAIAPLAGEGEGVTEGATEGSAALEVLSRVWPTCESLLSREMQLQQHSVGGGSTARQRSTRYMELVCAILVAAAKACGSSFAPQLGGVAVLLTRAYTTLGPEPCCLTALAESVKAAHSSGSAPPSESSLQTLREALTGLSHASLPHLERAVSMDGRCVRNARSDIAEAYFELVTAMWGKTQAAFSPEALELSFRAVLLSIPMLEVGSSRGSLRYVSVVAQRQTALLEEYVKRLMAAVGPQLVLCIIQAVASSLPRNATPAAADTIKALVQLMPAQAQHWLTVTIEAPDHLWSSLEPPVRKVLVSGIVQLAMRSPADLRSLLADFRLVCNAEMPVESLFAGRSIK